MTPSAPEPAIDVTVAGAPRLRAWADGRIEWSADPVNGGPPLRTARIDPARLAAVVDELRASPVLGGPWTGEVHTGPDARATSVRVRAGGELIVDATSWHEVFEADPRLVATASGVQPLGTRTRDAVLAEQPEEYRLFRRRWDYVLGRLRTLIPTPP